MSLRAALAGVVMIFAVLLLIYSQTMAFVWDEGFHLLAAQLISNGRTPYIDFCFPQTLLNAYWNALLMHAAGQNWRVTHVAAALEVAGAVFLMADFVLARFPYPAWRFPCALVTALLMACNPVVVQFGPIGQAYGLSLLLVTAGFRAMVAAVRNPRAAQIFAGGLLAGASAGSTLLTAPAVPIMLVWAWLYNAAGSRVTKAIAFVAGCLVAFLPEIILLVRAPAQTFFNVVHYQAIFRRVKWNGATNHDIDVFGAWLDSTPALLLVLLGIAGFLFLRKSAEWDRQTRGEFYLCSAVAAGLTSYIATAHPTFQRYFIVAVPFCAVLAALGFYAVAVRLAGAHRPVWSSAVVSMLLVLSIAKSLFDDRDATRWSNYDQIAQKIKDVTPSGGLIYADEHVYFLLRRTPPPAMEFSYSHKLDLPPRQAALYHIISESQLNKQVAEGKFATVESCKDDRIEELKLVDLFPNQKDIGDCSIFWGKVKPLDQ